MKLHFFKVRKCQGNGGYCKDKATYTVCNGRGWFCDSHYKQLNLMVERELIKKGEVEK